MRQASLHQQFKEAWRITFRNPLLWLLGLFASLTVANGFFESGFRNIFILFNLDSFFSALPRAYNQLAISDILNFSTLQDIQGGQIFSWNLLIIILIVILVVAVAIVAQITLILSVNRHSGMFASAKDFLVSPMERSGRFWDTLLTHVIFKVGSVIAFLLIALPLLAALLAQNNNAVVLSTLFFFFIFIPVAMGITAMRNFAVTAVVLDQRSALRAVVQAWTMFKRSLLISYESAFFILLVRVFTFFASVLILAVALIPAVVVATILISAKYLVFASIFSALVALFAVAFVLAVRGMYATYDQSVWVLVYKRLEEETVFNRFVSLAETTVEGIYSLVTSAASMVLKKTPTQNFAKSKPTGEAEKLIDQLVTTLSSEYGLNKVKAQAMKEELIKMAKKEQEQFMPSLKKAIAEMEHQYAVAKPKMAKLAKEAKNQYEMAKPKMKAMAQKAEKKIEKNIPVAKRYFKAAKAGIEAAKDEMKGGKKKSKKK